jgi:hypothetical protein
MCHIWNVCNIYNVKVAFSLGVKQPECMNNNQWIPIKARGNQMYHCWDMGRWMMVGWTMREWRRKGDRIYKYGRDNGKEGRSIAQVNWGCYWKDDTFGSQKGTEATWVNTSPISAFWQILSNYRLTRVLLWDGLQCHITWNNKFYYHFRDLFLIIWFLQGCFKCLLWSKSLGETEIWGSCCNPVSL